MEGLIAWLTENKQWVFSGAGIVVLGWVGRLIFKKCSASSSQVIRSGDSSTNIQAGRDIKIGKKNDNDVE